MEAHELLEIKWAEYNGLNPRGMVACSSGTAALQLAFEGLRLPPESRVVTSDYNMVACPRAINAARLVPQFVDCLPNLLLDPDQIDVSEEFLAVLPVHVYGRHCNMEAINEKIASIAHPDKRVRVIEDLAEAHGIKPHQWTDAACWSFYRNKIVAGEEGGAVWFRNPMRAKLARELRCLGFTEKHDYDHKPRGHNFRLAPSLAEKILHSLSKVEENLERRREIESWYNEATPAQWRQLPRHVPWVYDLRIPGLTRADQDTVVRKLREGGIEARNGFRRMSTQEEFRNVPTRSPVATVAESEVFYLPIDPQRTTRGYVKTALEEIERILK